MSFTMQTQPSLSERPSIYDLYTIDLNGGDLWYKVGIELRIGEEVLDRIKSKNSKPQLCKRAMFKEWLRVSPDESCTYYHLVQALMKVDEKVAATVYQTVTTDSEKLSDVKKPTTAQLPILHEYDSELKRMKEKVGRGDYFHEKLTSTVAPPPPASGYMRKPHTEIIHGDSGSLSPIESTSQSIARLNKHRPLELEGSFVQSRVEDMHASSVPASPDRIKGSEVCAESNHDSDQAGEIRSVSADAYQTASEDESILVFSYQHDGQETSTAKNRHEVSTKPIDIFERSSYLISLASLN